MTEEIEEENLCCYYKGKRPFIMLAEYFRAEDYISRRLSIMSGISYDNKIDFSEVIDLEEENNGIKYETIQRQAINLALSKGFLVLTGGPGTGKTTTLNAIISLYAQQGLNVMICAPTGRAAKRLTDLTGVEAKTIHRLLEVKFRSGETASFVHNENDLLDCDALIIDEMSMVDSVLFEAVLRAISVTCKLVLVGDSDQLPSVGAGNVLRDSIDSGAMPVVTLKEIFRQAQESDIVMNAHKIVNGEHIDLSKRDKDFFFFQRLDFEGLQDLIVDLSKNRLKKAYGFSPFEDIQVLSPTRKGPAGVVELNKRLQRELNPPAAGKSEIKTPVYTFRKGDKVMQTKNDYEILWKKQLDDDKTESGAGIFNGDIGVILAVNKVLRTATIDFEGRVCIYSGTMFDNLELAYAVTVHKSQGSEFNVVILAVFGGFDKLYYRNLLYTAVTRARKNIYVEKEMPLILRLLFCCGLRIGETVNIKVGDLDFERDLIVLRVTKKYKQRLIPFGKDMAEILYRYCIGMGILNVFDAYLFPAEDTHNHISTNSVGNYYRYIRKLAGISGGELIKNGRGACLHCFRHTFAVRSFDKNERDGIKASDSVPYLSTYLGHDSLYETEKYLKYSGNHFKDTLTKFEDYSGELFPEVIIYE